MGNRIFLPNIWRLGWVRDIECGMDVSNKMLPNVAKYQYYIFYCFWVIKGNPTRLVLNSYSIPPKVFNTKKRSYLDVSIIPVMFLFLTSYSLCTHSMLIFVFIGIQLTKIYWRRFFKWHFATSQVPTTKWIKITSAKFFIRPPPCPTENQFPPNL